MLPGLAPAFAEEGALPPEGEYGYTPDMAAAGIAAATAENVPPAAQWTKADSDSYWHNKEKPVAKAGSKKKWENQTEDERRATVYLFFKKQLHFEAAADKKRDELVRENPLLYVF